MLQKYYFLNWQLDPISTTMTIDTPTTIHKGEIWLKSQCEIKEEQLIDSIYACLAQHNYHNSNPISHTRSVWQRHNKKVVISLVDDFCDCASNRSSDTPYLFDQDTMVITDNFLNCPSVYKLLSPPPSFYGIYSYVPENLNWTPTRSYTFAVNRQDYKRMGVLLELYQNFGFNAGYVSFNCRAPGDKGFKSDNQLRQEFVNLVMMHAVCDHERSALIELAQLMPIKNHSIAHDQVYLHSWLNIQVETYSSDNVISLSEKTFRALVTPVPWVVHAGRYTVAKLRELGFDVLDDIVDHNYDRLIEVQHKKQEFTISAKNTIAHLKTQNFEQLKARCLSAAQHNQKILATFSQQWAQQQPAWLDQLSRDLA